MPKVNYPHVQLCTSGLANFTIISSGGRSDRAHLIGNLLRNRGTEGHNSKKIQVMRRESSPFLRGLHHASRIYSKLKDCSHEPARPGSICIGLVTVNTCLSLNFSSIGILREDLLAYLFRPG